MTKQDRQKFLAAKPDIDAAIRKHGLQSVAYVVKRRNEAAAVHRQLAAEKKRLQERMEEIESKLRK
jgi:hypothetical protein